jgi:purine-nucleoside phosphorylase
MQKNFNRRNNMSTAHINAANKGDIAETILMPGDPLRAKFIAENFLDAPVCYNEIRGMLGYTGTYKGVPISVQGSGMGMPSMGIYSYELIKEYGVKNLIRIGSAGSFREDIKMMDIVVGLSASTDSCWQHTYGLSGNFAPCCDYELLLKVQEASKRENIPIRAGNIVSCDVFYEDDENWWKSWAKVGVMAVEMEAAALYMNAARLGAKALTMVTISDHFITGGKLTSEEREKSFTNMMRLALEAAIA